MMPECVSYSPLFRQGDFFVRNSNRLSAMHKATPNIAYTKSPYMNTGFSINLVGTIGLEPTTPTMSRLITIQLNQFVVFNLA